MKFKTGDRLRLIANAGMAAEVGATAVVQKLAYYKSYVCVTWDRNKFHNAQNDGPYEEQKFEFLERVTLNIGKLWADTRWGSND
jgi:hypothetical protein